MYTSSGGVGNGGAGLALAVLAPSSTCGGGGGGPLRRLVQRSAAPLHVSEDLLELPMSEHIGTARERLRDASVVRRRRHLLKGVALGQAHEMLPCCITRQAVGLNDRL